MFFITVYKFNEGVAVKTQKLFTKKSVSIFLKMFLIKNVQTLQIKI